MNPSASTGLEVRQVVSVARTTWTVCYKIHAIPARRTEYRSSITLWPRPKRGRISHAQAGWHEDLVKSNWYSSCRKELRSRGYHGRWRWSPWGRFGDFWKSLTDFESLMREARVLDELRREPSFCAIRPSNKLLERPGMNAWRLSGAASAGRSAPSRWADAGGRAGWESGEDLQAVVKSR